MASPSPRRRPPSRGKPAPVDRFVRLAALLAALEGFQEPADGVVHRFFRANPALGAKDRAFLAESAFAAIRRWQWITDQLTASGFRTDGPSTARRRAMMAAALGVGYDRIVSELSEGERVWLRAALDAEGTPAEVVYAIPAWIWHDWTAQLPNNEAQALAQAMDAPAPLDLRVNTLKATGEQVVQSLALAGIQALSLIHI